MSDAPRDVSPARPAQVRQVLLALAWAVSLFIVFATWGPQSTRPHLASAGIERFGAYFLAAVLFTTAYPKRPWSIAAAAVALAVVLELGQFVAVGRDPGVRDVLEKALGGVFGVMAAAVAGRLEWRGLDRADG